MKKILLGSMLIVSCLAFGQKIKIKKDVVYVDDKEWLKVEDDGLNCSVFDKKMNEIIFMKFIHQNTNDNMLFNGSGKPNYYLVKFIGTDKSIEIRELPKDILKIIYKTNVINSDLTLDQDKLNILVEKYGNDFSKNNASTNTIIIQESRPKNGVNISLGR